MHSVRFFPLLLFACAVPCFAAPNVTSPVNGSSVTSPVQFVASAGSTTCAQGVASMGIYANNQLVYTISGTSMNVAIALNPGSYSTAVEQWDYCGGAATTLIHITVVSKVGVSVISPQNDNTYSSPVHYQASATTSCSAGIAAMGIYVNNRLDYAVNGNSINTALTLSPGAYNTVIEEWDNCGGASTTPVNFTVGAQPGVNVSWPSDNSTVTSPVEFVASATSTCADGVASMGIYVDNRLDYTVNGSSLKTALALSAGAHNAVVQEWDYCGGASNASIRLTVSGTAKTVTSIAVSPSSGNLSTGASQQFSATATYSDGSKANVTSSAGWAAGNPDVVTVSTDGLANGDAAGATTVTASLEGVSGSVPVSVTVPPTSATNVTTWHFDANRSGLNSHELSLTQANVTPETFGKLFSDLVDGYVYGQPLIMSNVTINGAVHNVMYVATENDSVYAFDADHSGPPLWKVSLLQSGETATTTGPILPVEGVTSTPVIDPSTNTLYVVSKEQPQDANATFRLSALDLSTGAQKFGGPVTIKASVPGTNSDSVNGVLSLSPSCVQRTALLLANGNVYFGFSSCHAGWLLAYNAKTLAQVGVFNTSPNLNGEGTYEGAGGIWMGSGGPVADSAGNIYVVSGNGPWDGKTTFSDSVLKLSPTLQLEDYFTPQAYAYMNCQDADLGAGGMLLIPGSTEAVVGGKTGKMYLVNTSNLGKEQLNDAGATQTLYAEAGLISPYDKSCTDANGTYTASIISYELFGTAAYFNGSVYLGGTPTTSSSPAGIRRFYYSGTLTPAGYTVPAILEGSMGTTPFISADGTSNGIVWMLDHGEPIQNALSDTPTSAVLRAYDADNLNDELYDSNMNPADVPGYGIKFTSPVVANGKVYITAGHDQSTATNPQGEIDVYGLN